MLARTGGGTYLLDEPINSQYFVFSGETIITTVEINSVRFI